MMRFRELSNGLKRSKSLVFSLLALLTCAIVLFNHWQPSLAQKASQQSTQLSTLQATQQPTKKAAQPARKMTQKANQVLQKNPAKPIAQAKPVSKPLAKPKLFPKSQINPVPLPTPDLVSPSPDTVLPTEQRPDPKKNPKATEPTFPPNPYPTSPKQEIRGVWLTNNDMNVLKDRRKLTEAIAQLGQLNFNTVYPVVWNSGYATYHSQVAQQAGIQSFFYKGTEGQDILADVSSLARQHGLMVVPWFEFGFMAPPTSELALNHPEWLTQQRDGSQTSISAAGEVSWLNPFHPEVQKFITDLVVEIITQYDVDGIQFDDHMSLPNQFGYDNYTKALYAQETKKPVPNNPEDADWTRWRANKITEFMLRLRIAVKERKPQAIVSVSPNYADFAYKFHLQDWRTWVNRGIVDELIVQVYGSDMNRYVNKITRPEMLEANQKISTAVGVLTGLRRQPVSMRQIQMQVQEAHDRGLGVVFFYFESLWNDAPEPITDRLLGFQYLFRSPARRV